MEAACSFETSGPTHFIWIVVMIKARAELWWNAGALHVGGRSSQLLWSVRVEKILRRILLLLQLPRSGRRYNVSGQEQRIASENRESVAFTVLSFCSFVEHTTFMMLFHLVLSKASSCAPYAALFSLLQFHSVVLFQAIIGLPLFLAPWGFHSNACLYYVYWTVHHLDSWIERD